MPEQQDAPYDPYIPSGQAAPQQQGAGGNARTQALQAVSLHVIFCCVAPMGCAVMEVLRVCPYGIVACSDADANAACR